MQRNQSNLCLLLKRQQTSKLSKLLSGVNACFGGHRSSQFLSICGDKSDEASSEQKMLEIGVFNLDTFVGVTSSN
jgi:hypothetical protein